MTELVIFKSKDGNLQLNINLTNDNLWLSQEQIAHLFGTRRQAITRHLKNIYASQELDEYTTCSKMEHMGKNKTVYTTKYYSIDAVISVGYRVNSGKATEFRIWANQILKQHLIHGFTIQENRLVERGASEIEQAVKLLHKTLINHESISEIGSETIQLIIGYAKTWHLLLAYDENNLALPIDEKTHLAILDYKSAIQAISELKYDLSSRHEASSLFGIDRNKSLESILLNIDQTFDGKLIYPSPQERAANLLYFVIKDHPFVDGNKRIACLMFLLYLKLQKIDIKLNDNGLVALALLIAESDPKQKDMLIRLIVNLLLDFNK